METLVLMCDLLAARVGLLDSEKECPADLVEACASIIYCAGRVEIPELKEIGQFMGAKFGKKWAEDFINNETGAVSQRVLDRLSVKPPAFEDIMKLLTDIAEQFDIDWKPNLKDDTKSDSHEALGAIASIEHTEAEQKGEFQSTEKIAYPGTLNVIVHKAQKLYDTQLIGKEKPYVKLRIQNDLNVMKTTVDMEGGRAPKWDQEHFPFPIKTAGQKLQVEIWNSGGLSDDHIGSCLLNIDRLISTPEPQWYRLMREQGKTQAGALMLSFQYLPLNMSPKNAGHTNDHNHSHEGVSSPSSLPPNAFPPSYVQPAPGYTPSGGVGGGGMMGGGMGMGVPAFGGGMVGPGQAADFSSLNFPVPQAMGGGGGGGGGGSSSSSSSSSSSNGAAKHDDGEDNPPEFDELEARFNALKKS